MEDFQDLRIQLKDIKSATDNFDSSKQIGRGGFGPVYKGELSFPEGRSMVAFKRLDIRHGQGHLEFMKEIMMLSKYKHENLVSLLRFSSEGDERILVYEYVSRGSLDRYLSNTSLTWTQRLKICVGVARALNYLHDPKGTHERVIHRDIKSSNILLDEKWTAKVSDFGLSKLAPANQPQTYVLSNVAGTPGYCDPLYFETYLLTKESDVYSFGVVLFEVLCGRLCCEYGDGELTHILVPMWKEYYKEKRLDEIICSGLKEQMEPGSLDMFSAIAYRCLNRDRKERPSMEEIVKELEITLKQQMLFMEELRHLEIQLEDITSATDNFGLSKLIGRNEFGSMYKGELSLPKRQCMVAFRRLDHRHGQRNNKFWREVMTLYKYKHENLVSLLHFCTEGDERILVYEYASRGSLDRYISDTSVTWTQRLTICIGVACALHYLSCYKNTSHMFQYQDTKTSNILLDEKWTAKLSDFVLSNDDPSYQQRVISRALFSQITYANMYSFGVVLFEILCGKLCCESDNGDLSSILVPMWIKCYEEKRLDEIIFPSMKEQMDPSSLETFSTIAYQCLKETCEDRPTTGVIKKELEMAFEEQELFDIIRKKVGFEELVRIAELAVPPLSYTSQSQLPMLFGKGFLVDDGKTWLSINKNGNFVEMISAIKCISGDKVEKYHDLDSRFSDVLYYTQDGFKVEVNTQFLSPHVTYAINLILGINHHTPSMPLRYKLDEETYYSNPTLIEDTRHKELLYFQTLPDSCIAKKREDGWWMVELYQFTSSQKKHDFRIEFLQGRFLRSEKFSCLLEGIEFRPVRMRHMTT